MSTPIRPEDIQHGDTIRIRYTYDNGAVITNEGKAFRDSNRFNSWQVELSSSNHITVDLIDRPKPPLPVITGAVIIAHRVTGLGSPHITLALRYDGYWVALSTGKVINASNITEWTLAKVVEA